MQVESSPERAASANYWVLDAQLVQRQALRHTPAGIPVLNCVLAHQSEQTEAGQIRKVSAQVKAVAIGPLAEQLDRQPLGLMAAFTGFLATPVRRGQEPGSSTALVFHIQALRLMTDSAASQSSPF